MYCLARTYVRLDEAAARVSAHSDSLPSRSSAITLRQSRSDVAPRSAMSAFGANCFGRYDFCLRLREVGRSDGYLTLAVRAIILFAVLIAFWAGQARADVSTFNEEFVGSSIDQAWSTWDGFAVANPSDTGNHATILPTGSHLSISFPGGAEHNMWWLRHAQLTRVYEGSGVYEIKVDSALDGNQQFGLIFESAPGTFLVFMLYAHDTIWGYVERFSNVGGTQFKNTFPGPDVFGHNTGLVSPTPGPYWLRVIVTEDPSPQNRVWKFQWSRDGLAWTTVVDGVLESTDPTENIGSIQKVGVFAGNQPEAFSAFDARFDHYRTYPLWALPVDGPANLLATPGDHQIALTWTAVGGAEQYSIYRSTTAGGPYSLIGSATTPGYLDSGLANGTMYAYVVTARVNGVESLYSGEANGVPHQPDVPAALPANGRLLVLRASELSYVLSDGQEVKQWSDSLVGASGAAVGSTGMAPRFVADAFSGHAAVRFDGQNDYLDLPAAFADFTNGMTLFVVARPTALQAGSKLLLLGNGAGQGNVALGRNGGGAGLQYFTTDSSGSYGWFGTADALTTNAAALYSVVQGAGAANSSVLATVSKNGVAVGSGTVFVPPVVTRSANYIGRSYWGGDGYFAGDIAEIILYNRALSATEQAAVRTYLGQKYGLDVGEAPPPPPLAAPGAVGATAGNGQVSLNWGAVSGASGYKVYRRATTTSAFVQIHDGAGTSYTDLGVSNGTTYGYVVKAYDSQRESANSAEVLATPAAPPVLAPPAQVPTAGLTLLLDAGNAALTASNGSEVTEWRDASGANRNAVTVSGRGPVLVTGALGGDAVLRFDGQNDYLDLPAAFADFTNGMTLFVVARPTALQAGSKLLLLGNGAGQGNVALGRNGGGAGLQYFTTDSGGNYGWFGTADALTTNAAALYSVVQGAGAANSSVLATVSKNGVAVGSGTVFVPPVVTRSANYIGRSYWGGDGYFAGDMAEIILYNRALSATEQAAVRTYLGQKYGLPAQ